MEPIKVSQSRVKKWVQCKQAHFYRYVDRLERKRKSRPLQFGTIIHEMLEAQADGDDPFDKLEEIEEAQGDMFRIQREELGDIVETARTIFEAYDEYYSSQPKMKYLKYNGKKSEHELEVEIANNIILVMKLDGIVRTPNKLRWLLEHKTFGKMPSDDDRWRSMQVAVYITGAKLLGMKPFDGVCWNYIRSKEPSIPKILIKGGMSRAACDTLPAVVIKTATEHEIEDYTDQLEAAEDRIDMWFQRLYMPVSSKVTDRIFSDFLVSSNEILEQGNDRCERNIDRHCSWCDFEDICRAELTGGDPDYVKEHEYGKREKRKEKVKDKTS